MPKFSVFDDRNNKRNCGDNDQTDNDIANVPLNPGICPQIISKADQSGDPCKCANNVVQHKLPELYFNDTRQYRGKRTNDGRKRPMINVLPPFFS